MVELSRKELSKLEGWLFGDKIISVESAGILLNSDTFIKVSPEVLKQVYDEVKGVNE